MFAAGGISGMISWAFTYPQDVIKSKIQADKLGPNAKYKGYMHCYKMVVAKDGHAVLTRGMASSLIRYEFSDILHYLGKIITIISSAIVLDFNHSLNFYFQSVSS